MMKTSKLQIKWKHIMAHSCIKMGVAYPSEVIFKLVRSTPRGTNSCDKSSHAFRFGQCQEIPHFRGWKADEMQGSSSMSYFNIVHLKQKHHATT